MFPEELSVNRQDVMSLAKIGNANTYTKLMKDLHEKKYIIYKPSHNPLIGSKVTIIRCDKGSDTTSDKTTDISSGATSGASGDTLYKLVNNKTYKLIKDNVSVVEDNLEKWIKAETEEKNIISFDFDKFILFFAEVTGKKIRNTQSLRKLINDILKTKDYTENDVYSVVKVKTKEWKGKVNKDGKKLDAWLDPKTLFRKSNFDKYVREADNAGNLDLFSTEDNLIRDEFGNVVGQKTDYADLAKYYGITEEEARKHYKPIN
jgi:uncharacterized phage protein (TIGR02220 family)